MEEFEVEGNRVLIIAEAGVNHNGDLDTALKMVDTAKSFGADIIKFQTGVLELVTSKYAPKAEYQKRETGADESQMEMGRKITLPLEAFDTIKKHCEEVGIEFLSTPFDVVSIEYLHNLGVRLWKVPSGEITNLPYLEKIAQTGMDVILSTGMSSMEEIKDAVELLRRKGAGRIILLHCTTEYPAPLEDINLRAMETIRKEFGVEVGYSDHTKGIEVSIAAVALGARVIEKHFTLDRNMEGPDHKASLEPNEFAELVRTVRNVEIALGSDVKEPKQSEIPNKVVARKSIIAKRAIKAGEVFNDENLTTKRPGNGISPMRWYEISGKIAKNDYEEDELILEDELKDSK